MAVGTAPPLDDAVLARDEIVPSVLAADFSRLGGQLAEVLDAGARAVHVDVMDGCFVPPITIGALVVDAIREQVHGADALLDVHLMVQRSERHVEAFAAAGADVITIHAEATPRVHRALSIVRELGCRAGLAIHPRRARPRRSGRRDLVLCMTVNPGWGGQPYIETSTAKVADLRRRLPDRVHIEVDAIGRALADKARTIPLPVAVVDKLRRITWAETVLTTRRPGVPTADDIAPLVGLGAREIDAIRLMAQTVASLDRPLGDDEEDGRLADAVADSAAATPFRALDARASSTPLSSLLQVLSAVERQVIELRFGLGGRDAAPRVAVGQALGLSPASVRWIEMRSLAKLRHELVAMSAA